ncbi:FeS cluster assembly protein SufB [Pirellulimonas nuda]|uniref:FeS cluster assembly protein SufB n=1 Tax=Pirellulimonas nuda TaxID=2528009 RepID=A0A518DB82_9BACT|nr:Fe-S cluster assembly protein SufD [Pirellulimonas nuda]QDU88751.1 FeS cluster assembly protein SufB [Pirellulimonas nuda]
MTDTLTAGSFTAESFRDFVDSRNEPGWVADARREAWRTYSALGWPSRNDEQWMRTDVRLFKIDRFAPPMGDAPSDTPPGLLSQGLQLAGSVASHNSHSVSSTLDPGLYEKGVRFGPIGEMLAQHGDLLRPYFERQLVEPTTDKFSALSSAFWASGAVLFVPKGVCIDQPLHVLSAISAGGVDLSRTLVILEAGADATLLTETASGDDLPGFHCGAIELIVGRGARLRFVNLQNWSQKVWHFAHQKAAVGREGRLQWTLGALGARVAQVNQSVSLVGQDAEAQVNGAMFTQASQHLCYNTHQHHEAPYCRSDLLYKNALQDRSRTVWRGMIKVDKPAQRTDAYQRNDNLMLSADARADSIPGLEIEADDVRCTHGSTSGRVDEQQLFYAMSRGFTRKEAIRMIVAGFFQQVFDRITIESVRDALAEAISQRVQDIS